MLSECGYTSIPKFPEKERLLDMIARYEVLDKPSSALEQFKEGLRTLGVLAVMKRYPAELETLFCYQGEVLSANIVDRIFTHRWSLLDTTGATDKS